MDEFPQGFLESAAQWADRRAVSISFERDEYSGWFAKISFRDAHGPYSAMVDAIVGRKAGGGRKAETPEAFDERVSAMLTKATVKAHAGRRPVPARSTAHQRATA